jgi:hypothetical protein
MAATPERLAEVSSVQEGSWLLQRYQSYGPAGQIPSPVVSELLVEASGFQSPRMSVVTGWLAVEKACQIAGRQPRKASEKLNSARNSMLRGIQKARADLYPDTWPEEMYRRQVALIDLPLYGALALNHTITPPDIESNQAKLANLATEAISEAREFRENGQLDEARHMDGFLAEVIIRMAYNRSAMRGHEGILGFAIGSTYRQDNTPYQRKKHRDEVLSKSNWDISLIIRQAEQDSKLAQSIGRLGQTAVQQSGLVVGDLWRLAAKLQIKSRRDAIHNDHQHNGQLVDLHIPQHVRWDSDQPIAIPQRGLRSVGDNYDPNQVTTLGVLEDVGLRTPWERLEVLELLAAEAGGEEMSPQDSTNLTAITKKVKQGILSRVRLIAA